MTKLIERARAALNLILLFSITIVLVWSPKPTLSDPLESLEKIMLFVSSVYEGAVEDFGEFESLCLKQEVEFHVDFSVGMYAITCLDEPVTDYFDETDRVVSWFVEFVDSNEQFGGDDQYGEQRERLLTNQVYGAAKLLEDLRSVFAEHGQVNDTVEAFRDRVLAFRDQIHIPVVSVSVNSAAIKPLYYIASILVLLYLAGITTTMLHVANSSISEEDTAWILHLKGYLGPLLGFIWLLSPFAAILWLDWGSYWYESVQPPAFVWSGLISSLVLCLVAVLGLYNWFRALRTREIILEGLDTTQ